MPRPTPRPDQLLINKMVLDEVRQYNRNIFTMWFDYQKAFDSIPHQWLFEALKLAKVPVKLTSTIERLACGFSIQTNESFSVTDIIKYLTGILQGDCLSLILFVLCVNPLSHLLNKLCDGYRIGTPGNRTIKINHLLFVDDLKTYAPNIAIAKEQLKLISQFTNDIGMRFGVDKCAYMYRTRTELEMDGLKISELQDTDSYKYLGADEDVAYRGTLNKDRVVKEYIKRIRKIWKSELLARNKVIAHNSFAVPILTPAFGILDWYKDEVEAIDIKTLSPKQ